MQPVWVLSVDLQTKTATFQSGLSDAAKSARGAFTQIKSGAGDMSRDVSTNMSEARHGVMLLGEEFGVHLPRALTSFIAGIGPVGAAMEAAFPFLAIAVGATLLIEHLGKMREAGLKLTEDQEKFGTSVQNAFNAFDIKMLQAEKRADELRGDHLGALSKELQIIDKQSLADLVHQFEAVAKEADVVFKDLETSWYQFGIGSEGAKHALDVFHTQYNSLLAQGKDKEASDLLAGTRKSAERILEMQKQAASTGPQIDHSAHTRSAASIANSAAWNELKKAGVGITEKEIASQQKLLGVYDALVQMERREAEIKKLSKANETTVTHNTMNNEAEAAAQARAETVEQERQQRVKAMEETYRDELTQVQEGERQQIDEAREGSMARVAAIDAALQEERDHLAEGTGFYRGLLTQRTNLLRQMAEEEKKLKAEAGLEEAAHEQKMGELLLAAQREHQALLNSAHSVSAAQRVAQEIAAANAEYQVKLKAFQQEEAALDKFGKDYNNKLKAIRDKEKQLDQQNANETAAIREKAEKETNDRVLAAAHKFNDQMTAGLTQVLMGHESFAKMMNTIGDQLVSTAIQNAIKMIEANMMGKESDAAKAARAAFNIGIGMGPAGIVLGPLFGALAFATVSAYADGGVVPGTGSGDIVPAMLTPGEGVVPKGVMEGLSNLAKSGGLSSSGNTTVVHVRPTYHVQTIDGNGMQAALEKHTDVLQRHFEGVVRKMNK